MFKWSCGCRSAERAMGLSALKERHLTDSRRGKNVQLPLPDLLRQSIRADWRDMRMSTTPSGFP